MENIKKIRTEREGAIVRAFYKKGIPLQKVEIFMLAKTAADIFESALIQVATNIPRVSESPDRLVCYDSSITGRHPIDGKVRRITQIFAENKVRYYTDGKEEHLNV